MTTDEHINTPQPITFRGHHSINAHFISSTHISSTDMASAAIERPLSSSDMTAETTTHSRKAGTLPQRWGRKLFGKGATHDIATAAKGGPPTSAAPDSATEETDPIQHVGGTGLVVNDPSEAINPAAPGEDETSSGGRNVADQQPEAGPSAQRTRRSPKLAAKAPFGAAADDSDDPTAGAGGLSAATRRSNSVGPSDDEDGGANETSRAASINGGDAAGAPGSRHRLSDSIDRIEFYHRDQPYFWLSNSSDHAVYLDGVRYATAEHLFQSLKFLPSRPEIANKVRKANAAPEAIREARKNIASVKRGWIGQGKNVEAMRTVLLLKFSQHSKLGRQLLLTGDAELIEASPTDAFWGSAAGSANGGIPGLGRNELGKALVRTRETIRTQAGLGYGSASVTV